MKTVQDFIKEIEGSAELQNELKQIKDEEALAEFLKKHDCDATAEEFVEKIKPKNNVEGELSDSDVAAVAGGEEEIYGHYEISGGQIKDWLTGKWLDFSTFHKDIQPSSPIPHPDTPDKFLSSVD